MSFYLQKKAGQSGSSRMPGRMKRCGLQSEIKARCQVLWDSISVQQQEHSGLWDQPEPKDLHASNQVQLLCVHLHPIHSLSTFPIPWWLLGTSFLTPVLQLLPSQFCSWHLVSRQDNGSFIRPSALSASLAQVLCLVPASPQLWVSGVPKRQQYSASSKT